MTIRHLAALALLALLGNLSLLFAQLPPVPGAVRGAVHDDRGQPVAGAHVYISQALPASVALPGGPPILTGPQVTSAKTDTNAQFVAFLKPGNYLACAQTSTSGLVNQCDWAVSANAFTVASNQTANNVSIVLAHGAVIPIHIDDPLQLLAPAATAIDPACRFQIYTAKGAHFDAPIVARSATSRDYSITIPYGAPVTLRVLSPHLAVNDNTGKPAATAGVSTNVPVGSIVTTLTYTVAGIKP